MGKTYYSPFAGYQFIIRAEKPIYAPNSDVLIDRVRELVADFALHRPEYRYLDGDGNEQVAPDISGNFFDLDAQAELKGWSEEEKLLAEQRLDWACERYPAEVRLWTKAPAARPWPTYDETHHEQVPVIAEATGTVAAALVYECENKNRKGVVAKLEALNAPVVEEPVEDPELTAA